VCLVSKKHLCVEYLEQWPEGEVKTCYKVLHDKDGYLTSPYTIDYYYKPGLNTMKLPVKHFPYEIPEGIVIQDGLHVCMNIDAAYTILADFAMDDEPCVIATMQVSKEDFMGIDEEGYAAFRNVYFSEDSYRTALSGTNAN
jgi:hypothetical protein